jgi:hypothetical protein
MTKLLAVAAAIAFCVASGGAAMTLLSGNPAAQSRHPVWTETAWPFPVDQWGKGKAFTCRAADCGVDITVFLRAKIGFCNCITGASDDSELDRMSDFELVGRATPLANGHEIKVGHMHGRSRTYRFVQDRRGKTAIAVVFNDRCDMVAATAIVPHERPASIEPAVIAFLNSPTVQRWAEITLGI